MDKLREAAQQALEHVQEFKRRWWQVPAFGNKVNKATREAITNAHSPIFELEHALRAALAEQPAEPVAWMWKDGTLTSDPDRADGTWTPLYTAPQPAKPAEQEPEGNVCGRCGGLVFDPVIPQPRCEVELTDEEIDALPWGPSYDNPMTLTEGLREFARAVIEAYKAKQGETNGNG